MNMKNESIYILKMGGSLITNKNEPFSLRKKILRNVVSEIIASGKKIIIIHGGGAFGHPTAKKYDINSGKNLSIENQIYGLAKTHSVMTELNKYVVDEFIKKEIPAMSIQTSCIFIQDLVKGIELNADIIKLLLDLGIIPILYGDILLNRNGDFSIISGDTIILKLCESLGNLQLSKVIFAMEEDGLYIEIPETGEITLAERIEYEQINTLNLANLGKKIDITGGITIKLNNIKKILNLGIPVQLVNGLKEDNIEKALIHENVKGTCFEVPGK